MKPPDDKLLTVREVSELIGFSTSVIYAGNCETHKLPKIEIWAEGRARPAIRFSYLDVMEWIASHRAQAKTRQKLLNVSDYMRSRLLRRAKRENARRSGKA